MTTAVVLIGPPGSGKSMLSRTMSEELDIPLVSAGHIARELEQRDIHTRTELARGGWAPELAMREEVRAQIEAASTRYGGFVIEGFPRRVEQLYLLEQMPGIRPLYFLLDIDPLLCLRRLVARGRTDDHADAVAARWKIWQEHTVPMVEMLTNWTTVLDALLGLDVLAEMVTMEYERDLSRA